MLLILFLASLQKKHAILMEAIVISLFCSAVISPAIRMACLKYRTFRGLVAVLFA